MSKKKNSSSSAETARPNLGLLYLKGLLVYLSFRLAALGETLLAWLTAPIRLSWSRSQQGWQRLKPWLGRHKWRILYSVLALVGLTVLIGGAVTLYLWRAELLVLAGRSKAKLVQAIVRLRTRPVVVVATQVAEEIPVTPGVNRVSP